MLQLFRFRESVDARATMRRLRPACAWSSVATAVSAAAVGLAAKATAAQSSCSQQARVIVDAGSGWSRVEGLAIGDGGCVSTVSKRRLEAQPLAEVLAQRQARRTTRDGGAARSSRELAATPAAWVAALKTSIEDMGLANAPILIGATAGVRDALANGSLSVEEVEAFRGLLKRELVRASFEILSGEEEAILEARSCRFCAKRTFLARGDHGGLGMLSSGGMSSQVVVPTAGGRDAVLSLETRLKSEGNRRMLEDGVEAGLASYGAYLDHEVLPKLESALAIEGAGRGGAVGAEGDGPPITFVAIEILGGIGEKAGFAQTLVSRECMRGDTSG